MAVERWRENWRVLAGPGAVRIELGRSAARRAEATRTIGVLPSGTPVVLAAAAPGAARRCRRVAAAANLRLERSYLAFPRVTEPAYLVEDAAPAIRLFLRSMLAAPPSARLSLPLSAGVTLLRVVASSRLVRALAPGRVTVGRTA